MSFVVFNLKMRELCTQLRPTYLKNWSANVKFWNRNTSWLTYM